MARPYTSLWSAQEGIRPEVSSCARLPFLPLPVGAQSAESALSRGTWSVEVVAVVVDGLARTLLMPVLD